MEELDIDREFEAMCPALLPDEYRLLEEGILADGCRDPIVVWKGVIIDGHNRYEICRKHNITFKIKTISLPDREAAVKWIARNQLGRRNLNEGQRATLAARMVTATVGRVNSANLQNCITTADAAELCNVSTRTVASAKKVIDHGSAALQQSVAAGEVAPSVAAKVAELPKAEQRKVVAKGPAAVKAKAKEITEGGKVKQYNDPFDPATIEQDDKPGPLFSKLLEHLRQSMLLLDAINKVAKNQKMWDDVFASLECANKDITKWRQQAKR
jgi:GH24 family phage-related lysozyme (muramidase)